MQSNHANSGSSAAPTTPCNATAASAAFDRIASGLQNIKRRKRRLWVRRCGMAAIADRSDRPGFINLASSVPLF